MKLEGRQMDQLLTARDRAARARHRLLEVEVPRDARLKLALQADQLHVDYKREFEVDVFLELPNLALALQCPPLIHPVRPRIYGAIKTKSKILVTLIEEPVRMHAFEFDLETLVWKQPERLVPELYALLERENVTNLAGTDWLLVVQREGFVLVDAQSWSIVARRPFSFDFYSYAADMVLVAGNGCQVVCLLGARSSRGLELIVMNLPDLRVTNRHSLNLDGYDPEQLTFLEDGSVRLLATRKRDEEYDQGIRVWRLESPRLEPKLELELQAPGLTFLLSGDAILQMDREVWCPYQDVRHVTLGEGEVHGPFRVRFQHFQARDVLALV
jgi:hypothetical protein